MTQLTDTIEEIHCPLCGYNLRGLSEARCPECGAKFDFDELRDPARRLHPYLFEHHPEHNVGSFFSTLMGGLRPRKFWTTLYPTQPSRPRRLIAYFIIYSLFGLFCATLIFGTEFYAMYTLNVRNAQSLRAQWTRYYSGSGTGIHPGVPTTSPSDFFQQLLLRFRNFGWAGVPSEQDIADIKRQYGSVQNYINQAAPQPGSRQVVINSLREAANSSRFVIRMTPSYVPEYVVYALLIASWPIAVALNLALLRATMRQAKVRFTHLLRVGIYCGDGGLWLGIVVLIPAVIQLLAFRTMLAGGMRGRSSFYYSSAEVVGALPLVVFVWMTYRLAVAIRRYLRFRHAAGIAIAVQIIFGLLTLKILLTSRGM